MNNIETGPYEIEVADPSFCGECGKGSTKYTFASYAELLAFRQGLEALDAEHKIVERWGENLEYWAYEDEGLKVFNTKVETYVRFCIDTNYRIHARDEKQAEEFSINRAEHEIKRFLDEGDVEALVPYEVEIDGVTWIKGQGTTHVCPEEIVVVYAEDAHDEMEQRK